MKEMMQVLAISEDTSVCDSICRVFESEGHKAICVSSPSEALQLLQHGFLTDFLLIDVAPHLLGDDLFIPALMRNIHRDKLCILSTAGDTLWGEFAERWKINMTLALPLLREDVDKLTSRREADPFTISGSPVRSSANCPHYHMEELDNNRFFLAASPAMMRLYRDIRVLAHVDIPVLIMGESGVGKENVAMLLHKYHARSEKKLLNINCAALPTELLESELFGYEAGAFTGATKSKPGLFELANKGTLLLDEIGEMSPQMQAKLLHVLQDGSFCRLGARSASRVDVRVLAATNINMQEAIVEKRFREDLYYRLNTLTITVPPLRERRDEISPLMHELFRRGAIELGQPMIFPDRIIEAAQDYDWPGNLRELRNFITRTLILRDEKAAYNYLQNKTRLGHAISSTEEIVSQPDVKNTAAAVGMKDAVSVVKNEIEIKMLQNALSASGWNRRRAATNLNISYRTLLYKIKQHRLTV
jgi:transcriptional regulator with PAS, ATPase and Fis domain